MKKTSFAIIGIAALMLTLPNAYSTDKDLITYLSITELTQTSLTLADSTIESGDFDAAKKFIDFGSKQFSNNLLKLIENEDIRNDMSKKGKQSSSQYSFENLISNIKALYDLAL